MTFNDWVKHWGGRTATAKLLKVDYTTVRYWFTGKNTPKRSTMVKIVELTKGEVTFEALVTGKAFKVRGVK